MNKQAIAMAVAMTCAAAGLTPFTQAQAPRTMIDSVRTGENRQSDIKNETQRTVDDLDAIVAEFERNGLGDSADVQVLRSIRDVLGNLTDKEMAKVIALLQAARSAPNQSKATTNVAEAVQGQKTIIIQLQQMLLEFQRQQELTALSLRFARLAEDQHKNMKAARSLARVDKTAYTEQQAAMLSLQRSEQAAIHDQVVAQLKKLADLGKDAQSDTAEKIARVLDAANSADLVKILAQAAADLNQSKLFSAATREKTARDQLRDLARVVAPPREPMAIIQEAIETVSAIIVEQKTVGDSIKSLSGENLAEKTLDVEQRQADLVDGTDVVRKDILQLAPEAAGELQGAEDRMQLVRSGLAGPKVAADNSAQAMQGLEKARTRLLDQLALLKKQEELKDAIDQARQLKEQITALRIAQEALKTDTAAKAAAALSELGARQGELLQTARDLILLVTSEAPAATVPMQEATRDMDRAQTAMSAADGKPDALRGEQSAIENLIKAEKALDDQIAQLEKAKEDLAKLEKARDDIAKAIQKEQKIEAAAAKLAAKQEKEKQQPDQPKDPQDQKKAEDIAQQQQEVAKDAEQIKDDIAGVQKDATDALDNAQGDMQKAKDNLDKQDAPSAQANATDAMANLNKAKDAIDQKIEDLQKQMGQPEDPSAKLDDIAKALEQAQKDVAGAQEQMGQPQPQMDQAGNQMDKTAADLTKAAAEDQGALPEAAKDAMVDAEKALTEAAAAAGQPDAPKAKEDAGKAQEAIAKAQAAVAMAQAGMKGEKADQKQADGQKGQPGQPGKPGKPEKADERNSTPGKGQRNDADVNAGSGTGGVRTAGASGFLALPARDRDAIMQDRKEKYPEEYGAMIEKYLKDLSDTDR